MNISDNATHLIIVLCLDICGLLLILIGHEPGSTVFAGMLTVTGTVLGYHLGSGQAASMAAARFQPSSIQEPLHIVNKDEHQSADDVSKSLKP